MTTIQLSTRRDLAQLPGFSDLRTDSQGVPTAWGNQYECGFDGNTWSDSWSCQCEDDCSECGKSISPYESEWIGPPDRISRALWDALPEPGGEPLPFPIEVILAKGEMKLAEGWVVFGIDAPALILAGPRPAFDALMRAKVNDLPANSVVYAADLGESIDGPVVLASMVFEGPLVLSNGQEQVEAYAGSERHFTISRPEMHAFVVDWLRENYPITSVPMKMPEDPQPY